MSSDFGAALDLFKEYFSKYEQYVKLNPRVMAEVEAIIRWSSYLIATRKSPVLGELLSSGANLLQLCNDIILRNTNETLRLNLKDCATQLKTCLSVIHSLELLAEIYARETFGLSGKWAIITVIQIAKAAIKLILLLIYNQGITRTQSIVPLDRIHFSEIIKSQETSPKSVVLKSTGREMRSIADAPPRKLRQRLTILMDRYREPRSTNLTDRQLYGEILHIARPISHLALMGAFGSKSWAAYLTALLMDVSSLQLVRSPSEQFNSSERIELGQRAASLLLYMLRSPFFDEYTKTKALSGLAASSESIPLVGNFLSTFFNYIPDWQRDYFRVWSE